MCDVELVISLEILAYGPAFCWGWNGAGIEDNKTISIFEAINWKDILSIHKWTIDPILWKIQYGWMVILQFGIVVIYDLLIISLELFVSSNADSLFVNKYVYWYNYPF